MSFLNQTNINLVSRIYLVTTKLEDTYHHDDDLQSTFLQVSNDFKLVWS